MSVFFGVSSRTAGRKAFICYFLCMQWVAAPACAGNECLQSVVERCLQLQLVPVVHSTAF